MAVVKASFQRASLMAIFVPAPGRVICPIFVCIVNVSIGGNEKYFVIAADLLVGLAQMQCFTEDCSGATQATCATDAA